jgi:hypothetical protein
MTILGARLTKNTQKSIHVTTPVKHGDGGVEGRNQIIFIWLGYGVIRDISA